MTKNKEEVFDVLKILETNMNKETIEKFDELFEKKGIKEFLNDEELKISIKSLFDNNLNLSVASKKNFMHRNTLVYRVEKVKKMTGFDAKSFEDATRLKIILDIFEGHFKV